MAKQLGLYADLQHPGFYSPDEVFRVDAVVDFYLHNGDRSTDMDRFEASLTQQEFAEECDINTIMEKYERSGAFTHVNLATPIYMDVTQFPDLRGSMDAMREAGEAFASLPAAVRKEFDNDPQAFVDFAQNSENIEQMREWGLAPPIPVPPAPQEVVVKGGRLDDLPAANAVVSAKVP